MSKTHIIIHHSATDTGDIESFRRYHMSKGWRDVGYHYVITKEGVLQTGRHEDDTAAACKEQNMNTLGIHICLVGHFDKYEPNSNQLKTLINICKNIMGKRNIPITNIKRHTDYANYKTCPGTKFPFGWFLDQLKNKDNSFELAIKKIADKGIISSPNYWLYNDTWKKEYVELLIKKFAKFIE